MARVDTRSRSHIFGTAGMTLVELIIAIGITAIIMGISIGIFVSQFKNYRSSQASKSSQGDAQKALSIIKEDIALAGWGVMPQMSFFFLDGGANQPDQIYVNDTTLIGIDPGDNVTTTNNLLKMVDSNCAACRRYTDTIGTGTSDIDGDGKSDFKSIAVLVCTGGNATTTMDTDSNGNLPTSVPAGSLVTPAFVYCVDDGNATHSCYSSSPTAVHRTLRRAGRDTGGALQPMAENVVDLQVVYGDGSKIYGADNCTSYTPPQCQMNPFDPSKIKWVDLTILTRSVDRVRSPCDPKSCRPAAGNHPGSTAPNPNTCASNPPAECGYEYRAYKTRIVPFNSIK